MKSVLIIEDDPTMLRGLEDNFQLKGYHVRTAWDGEQGLNTALTEKPDIIILDIMLPKIDGYDVCAFIRKRNLDMPIIMLTAKNRELDIVRGLNLGVDDYLTKPFSIKELLARAEAFIRRRRCQNEPTVYRFGSCELDTERCTLTRDAKEISLTPGEFDMLRLFVSRAGCALTNDEILNAVWGYSRFISSRDVDRFVASLRNKIEPDALNPSFIHSIADIGYRFDLPQTDGNSANN